MQSVDQGSGASRTQLADTKTPIAQATGVLKESQDLLRMTLQQMDQGLVLLDQSQVVRLCNPRACELLQLSPAVLREGASFDDIRAFQNSRGDFSLVTPAVSEKIRGADARLFPLVYDWPRPDGTTLEVRRVQLPDGGSVDTFADVTQHRASEAAVRESERLYRLLAEHVSDVVIWSRLDTTRAYVSPSAKHVFGYEPEELIGRRGVDLIHPDDRELAEQVLQDASKGSIEERVLRIRYRRKDGSWLWMEGAFTVTLDSESGRPNGYIASLRDITERHEAETRANYLARHDQLTKLPNRTSLYEKLEEQLSRVRAGHGSCALIYGDLDGFKNVNDTLGHAAGDLVLRVVAERLQSVLGPDTLVARLGGDEFLMLLTGADAGVPASRLLAQKIVEAVAEPISTERKSVTIGICLGVSYGPRDGAARDDLLRSSDLALFAAKAKGSGSVCLFDPAMAAALEEKRRLEVDVRQAVLANEFDLHYQPIIDLQSGRISGAEALLRWSHPVRGTVPPSVFVPVLEELGLIDRVGAWALLNACKEAAAWPPHVRIAVNVSAVQFENDGLGQSVMLALASSGISPDRLELEITETTLMQNVSRVTKTLKELRTLGVRVALDDFGTGYSSLSYLPRFPLSKLKLDRSFVADLNHHDMKCIVRAIVALAQGLDLTITAEGVETEADLENIRRKGCHEVQGYYFSRPLPSRDFRRFISSHDASTKAA